MNIKLLVIILLALAGIPVVMQQMSDNHKPYAFLNSVQTLDKLNAELNDRLLRTYSGLDKNYDALARISKDVDRQLVFLNRLKAEGNEEASKLLERYHDANEIRSDLLENYKSHNSVLRNSRHYTPIAIDNLQEKYRNMLPYNVYSQLSKLKVLIMEYSVTGSQLARINLKVKLKDFSNMAIRIPPEAMQEFVEVVNHTKVILREQPMVERYLQKAVNANVGIILRETIDDSRITIDQLNNSVSNTKNTLYVYLGFLLLCLLWIGAGTVNRQKPALN